MLFRVTCYMTCLIERFATDLSFSVKMPANNFETRFYLQKYKFLRSAKYHMGFPWKPGSIYLGMVF